MIFLYLLSKRAHFTNLNYNNYKQFCQGGLNVCGKGFLDRLAYLCTSYKVNTKSLYDLTVGFNTPFRGVPAVFLSLYAYLQ